MTKEHFMSILKQEGLPLQVAIDIWEAHPAMRPTDDNELEEEAIRYASRKILERMEAGYYDEDEGSGWDG